MNFSYVIAVAATRLLGLAMILILFHLMPAEDFGTFTLINTNAMSVYLVFGAWLIAIGNRALVTDTSTVDYKMMSAVAFGLLGMMAIVVTIGIVLQFALSPPDNSILLTMGLAAVLIIYEATIASKNALGLANAYAIIVVGRNILALFLAVGLVAVGAGVTGAIAAIGASALVAIFAQPLGRRLWGGVRYSPGVFAPLKPYLGFGVGGALQLGCYILVNAPLRNVIALKFGPAAAGVWSITTDLYFGPLALVANSYALSQVRLIYLAASQKDEHVMRERCRALLEFSAMLAALYAAGSIFFAIDAVGLVVPTASGAEAAAMAIPAALFGVAIMMLYCLVTVVLVNGQAVLVAAMIASVAAISVLPMLWCDSLFAACGQAAIGANAAVLAWSIFTVVRYRLFITANQLVRLSCAVACFIAVAALGRHFLTFEFAWIAIAALATAAFLATAWTLRVNGLMSTLPRALRDR